MRKHGNMSTTTLISEHGDWGIVLKLKASSCLRINRSGCGTWSGPDLVRSISSLSEASTFVSSPCRQGAAVIDPRQHTTPTNTRQRHVEHVDRAPLHPQNQVDIGRPAFHDARSAGFVRKGLAWSRERSSLFAHTASPAAADNIENIRYEAFAYTISVE